MGWGPGDRVLLPAYACESVVVPFVAAGLAPEFYAVKEDLSVDLDDLARRTGPGVRAGIVIHYFGWPQPGAVQAWLRGRSPADGNVFWIEDLTHALFTRVDGSPLGTWADARLASYRKLLPCPDGCGLSFREALPLPRAAPRASGWCYRAHGIARTATMVWAGFMPDHRGAVPRAVGALRSWRAGPVEIAPWSPASRRIIERFDIVAAAAARRRNAARLLERVRGRPGITPLFSRIDPGVVPMVLPVRVVARDQVRSALAARGVEAVHHWPRPAAMPAAGCPVADRLRAELLSLPVDERYGTDDMDRLGDLLTEVCHYHRHSA